MFPIEGNSIFDQIFSLANKHWIGKPKSKTAPAMPSQVRDVRVLQAIIKNTTEREVQSCGKEMARKDKDNVEKRLFIPFDRGSAELSLGAIAAIEKQVGLLPLTHSGALFCVVGSSDLGGSAQLGKDRADAVERFLKERQVRPRRVVEVDRGNEQPAVTTAKATEMRLVIIKSVGR